MKEELQTNGHEKLNANDFIQNYQTNIN